MAQQLRLVGTPLERVDALEKALGSTVFGADYRPLGCLTVKVLRSPLAHARLLAIDTTRARRVPGVRLVATGDELTGLFGGYLRDEPPLARGKVRYCGEPVAAVCAQDEETAEDALELVTVQYDPLPGVFAPGKALEPGAPLVHEELESYQRPGSIRPVPGTNICHYFKLRKGNVEEGFAKAYQVFENTYTLDMIQHAPLEPHVALAQADASGHLTVWSNTQGPWECRRLLQAALGLAAGKVRVISLPAGGAFGGKIDPRFEPLLGALAFRLPGRTLRLLLTREEEFACSLVRQPTVIRIKTGVTKEGLLLAREIEGYWDAGAYAVATPNVCRNGSYQGAGPYRIPHVKIDGYTVYTNNPVAGALRGFGVPEAAWAYESQMDVIAGELGLDPMEIRLRNGWEVGDEMAHGEILRCSVGLKETLHRAAQDLGWGQPLERCPTPTRRRGRGIACIFKHSRAPGTSQAFVKLHDDGAVEVLSSSIDFGQGLKTILTQIVAEVLHLPPQQVRLATPDTDVTPYDIFSTSSRTTFHMGNAVRLAAEDVRQQLIAMATEIFEAPEELVQLDYGTVSVPGRAPLTYQAVIQRYYGAAASVLGRGSFGVRDAVNFDPETGHSPRGAAYYMFATQAVELEVDTETGQVCVLKIAASHDLGKAINPALCHQQIDGGLGMGVGAALTEFLDVQEGRVLNPHFLDYKMPTALDLDMALATSLVEAAHDEGPWGAKGVGEPVLAPTAAAIGNALADALGVRFLGVPMTAERIREALRRQGLKE